ncbi:ABC amino acid transporter, periplasmic ligand binding protein [Caballeronia pedi]|uniref:ABC amino acid transporter, periplasmic ligand binding protein n=1 Tax=Caballeronia pedi TaxID=1777141 RepID=A0A157ZU77_9BURK|nr:ABC transporter substrate-binding protein [Caballeronia pedi]SAK49061.1 ABC amino acid transporter, periplasmic ligand binding protein [Caballeronia pedi]
MTVDRSVIDAFTPTGKLRASINLGNPILANKDAEAVQPHGVSVDLAYAFAKHLSVELELVVFDAAGKSVQAVSEERADFGFFAIDPLRGETIAFTAPYVLIEGYYLVRDDSPITTNADIDQPHNRVAVGKGSAYDLFLTRELKSAQIVRSPTSPTVVQTYLEQGLEVAAGVKQQLESDARKTLGLRLLNERFMVIQQAMGVPKSRGLAAAETLRAFVEEEKRSGFVADALERHGIKGASVAPLI